MAITRRALLISNPGEVGDEHYCKGVFIDVENYNRFLVAAHGGLWNTWEIIPLERPTTNLVRDQVKALSDVDYSFIAFAGHGWFSKPDDATVLTLRKGERISSLELLEGANKRTLVLDCCREIYNETAILERREKMALSAEGYRRRPTPQLCRNKFDEGVSTATRGVITLHSCSPGETSGDSERVGGRYTSSLIGGAVAWADNIAGNAFDSTSHAYSTVAAHAVAEARTKSKSGGTQTPWIDKPRTERNYFPFAVFA
ncbi:MAG TPA: caspase family protein [Tepidisphaeraceae bacterium]|jgi:hypothetical protein|nr:caspase family protein [Tepidisphaeraceae bacterium]